MTTLLIILEVSSCCLIRSDKSLPNKYSDSLSEAGSFSSVRLENSFVRQDRKRLRLCTLKPLKADLIHIRDCWSLSSTSSLCFDIFIRCYYFIPQANQRPTCSKGRILYFRYPFIALDNIPVLLHFFRVKDLWVHLWNHKILDNRKATLLLYNVSSVTGERSGEVSADKCLDCFMGSKLPLQTWFRIKNMLCVNPGLTTNVLLFFITEIFVRQNGNCVVIRVLSLYVRFCTTNCGTGLDLT